MRLRTSAAGTLLNPPIESGSIHQSPASSVKPWNDAVSAIRCRLSAASGVADGPAAPVTHDAA